MCVIHNSLHRDDEAVKSPVDTVDRWMHDLYIEEKQGPRTEQEKERVSKYLLCYMQNP